VSACTLVRQVPYEACWNDRPAWLPRRPRPFPWTTRGLGRASVGRRGAGRSAAEASEAKSARCRGRVEKYGISDCDRRRTGAAEHDEKAVASHARDAERTAPWLALRPTYTEASCPRHVRGGRLLLSRGKLYSAVLTAHSAGVGVKLPPGILRPVGRPRAVVAVGWGRGTGRWFAGCRLASGMDSLGRDDAWLFYSWDR
jgi:hypothetical protein